MSIVTAADFQRVHNNGTVLVDVPKGTKLTVKPFYYLSAWKMTAEHPVSRYGETVFHVNEVEYKTLVGA